MIFFIKITYIYTYVSIYRYISQKIIYIYLYIYIHHFKARGILNSFMLTYLVFFSELLCRALTGTEALICASSLE